MTKKTTQSSTNHSSVIPLELQQIKLPQFEEKIVTGKEYVRFGDDNLFPQFLIALCNKSSLHNAIVTSKLNYAFGKGLLLEDVKNASTRLFTVKCNPRDSLDEIYRKCLWDYILFGSFCINVIWDTNKEYISQIYHVDIANIRSGHADRFGDVKAYYYSDNWMKCTGNDKCKKIDAFDATNREGSQLYYFKDWRPGCTYYSLPSYVGCLNSIATDAEITNFHLSHLKNGMCPSKLISFTNGYPTSDEEMKIKRQLEDLYTGSDAAGKFLLSFTDDPSKVPVISTLSADNLDEQFIQLEESVLQQILSGHKVTSPLLVGIRNGGGLGNNTEELMTAYQIFQNTVIIPLQIPVVNALNMLLSFTKGYNGGTLQTTSVTPVSFTWSESILSQILTKNEMRARIGLGPIEDSDADLITEESTSSINNE